MRRIYAVPEYVVSKYIPERIAAVAIQKIAPAIAYKYVPDGVTVSELARTQGVEHFDVALPIDMVRDFQDKTGFNPVGHFVMDYTNNSYGFFKPVSIEGQIAQKIFNHIKKV